MLAAEHEVLTQVTALLRELAAGHADSLPQLFARVQNELRRVAHRERLALRAGDTLSTTALINEAYLKLRAETFPAVEDRKHFYGIAARAMRQVLVDYARSRTRQKRGGGERHETLSAAEDQADSANLETTRIFEINAALDRLEAVRPRLAQVVYLRFYAGLSDREIGVLLGVEESTVRRDWLKARGWLFQAIEDPQ
jgi:RNA polymerase sigma factor (TIGR02999 family)